LAVTGTRRVVFRADAGPAIGTGHLRRCLTLANEFRKQGCELRFVCEHRFGRDLENLLAPHGIVWLHDLGSNADGRDEELWDAQATLSLIGDRPSTGDWVVVDNYRLGNRWERMVREAGYRIAAIDDFRTRMHHADLLVSDSEAPFDPALNELEISPRILLGRRFAIVDPEYEFSPASATSAAGAKTLLVSYGGSDPTGETLKSVNAIRALKNDGELGKLVGRVDIVLGVLNQDSSAIIRAVEGIQDMTLHSAVSTLAPLMRQADLVLTAGGNTMVEALALRKPCLVTMTSGNQSLMVDALHVQGVIRCLGGHSAVGCDDIFQSLTHVLRDLESFAADVIAKAPFDHLGAHRVATEILASEGTDA
jgi:UDP-2,4-diacetamido-2,4,6-trideoxy-beta-L-altropyranose hydrolase